MKYKLQIKGLKVGPLFSGIKASLGGFRNLTIEAEMDDQVIIDYITSLKEIFCGFKEQPKPSEDTKLGPIILARIDHLDQELYRLQTQFSESSRAHNSHYSTKETKDDNWQHQENSVGITPGSQG